MKEFKVGDRVVVYAGKRKVGIITTTDAGHDYFEVDTNLEAHSLLSRWLAKHGGET